MEKRNKNLSIKGAKSMPDKDTAGSSEHESLLGSNENKQKAN